MFGDEHDGSSSKPYQLPTMSDMLICFPTQTGTYLYKCYDYQELLTDIESIFYECEILCILLSAAQQNESKKLRISHASDRNTASYEVQKH